jgi:hypothetical protein
VGFGAASLALNTHLRLVNVPTQGHPLGWTAEQVTRRVQQRRYFAQWPATAAFYGVWTLSAIDAARVHRREALSVSVGQVGERTTGLVVSGGL